MRKTMFRWLLALAILLPCMIAAASAASGGVTASGTCGGEGDGTNLTWTLYGDGELVISGTGAMASWSSESSVPWYSNRSSVKTVTIGDGVTNIGRYAFYYCMNLTSVTIPNSVTSVEGGVFYCCSLTTVTIPDSVTSIGGSAFSYCKSLTEVTIPDGVTSIGNYAFYQCTSLTSVTVGTCVAQIGEFAFSGCYNLQEVEFLGQAKPSMNRTVFPNAGNLVLVFAEGVELPYPYWSGANQSSGVAQTYSIPVATRVISDDGMPGISRKCYSDNAETGVYWVLYEDGTLVVSGEGTMAEGVFARRRNMVQTVHVEVGVTSIGNDAFEGCTSLTSVTIPNSVTTIGDYAFYSCTSLTGVYFLGDVPADVGGNVFNNCDNVTVYYHAGTSGWPDSDTWQSRPLVVQPHSEAVIPAVAATCGETGLTEGSHCSVCQAVITAQEVVPATGQHGYQLDAAVEATCTETGLTAGASCPTCGYVHLAQEVIPATGHSEVIDPAVEATCTETGLTEGSHCSVCGEVIVEQEETPVTDHTPVTDPAVEPTCAAVGLTEGSHCDVCDEVLVAQESVAKNSHTVVIDQPKDAACAEVGYSGTGMHCSVCGEILLAQTEIPALGHDTIDHAAKAPTTDSVGWEAYQTCSRCDYTTYVELPKLEAVTPTRFRFSLEVVSTIVVDGQTVEICRWVWTPVE